MSQSSSDLPAPTGGDFLFYQTEDEIKTLVVDDKWQATLAAAVQGELDRVSQTLTGRVRQLAERYAVPLPQLAGQVAELETKVSRHLERMGFKP
jgi:type I restriction enzyme M protein